MQLIKRSQIIGTLQLHFVRLYAAGFNLTVESDCVSSNCALGTCLGLQAGPPCKLFVGSAGKPASESIRRVSVWSSSKNETRDFSGGLRGLQPGSESLTHAFAWSSPNLNPETICCTALLLSVSFFGEDHTETRLMPFSRSSTN